MNPLTNVKNLNKINDRELEMGIAGTHNSWHSQYKDSAWVFFGGLSFDLTEGDIITVFSEYGEVVHINLVRDNKNGCSRGFGFLCYEDQRSTILAVDNLNGFTLLRRIMRVDHVETYKLPKDLEKMDDDRKKLFLEGCAPKPRQDDTDIKPQSSEEDEEISHHVTRKRKKEKKAKKLRKSKKERRESSFDGIPSEKESSRTYKHSSSGSRSRHHRNNKNEKFK